VPAVVIQPALLYGATVAAIPVLHWLWPLSIVASQPVRVVGALLFIVASVFWSWGAGTMRRAGTNILPINPTVSLVKTGPFRISRNPLYVALAVTVIGVSLIFNTWWGIVLFVPYQLVMHFGVVLREEVYLQQLFGDAYRAYCLEVRRWL
jgi:protein-S-isoprenylcysteine O-methyltransferase Ste14